MKRIIKLPARLGKIAEYIDSGSRVADIGTDHGYLPVYLAQAGIARRITASDISAGSLAAAKRSAAKHDVTGKIEFINAPGLDGISQTDVDVIVIAGVGGETILGILQDAPWTIEASLHGNLKIILQPQTKLDVLKNFLHDNGYIIKEETSVIDRGRKYTILVVGKA